MLLILLVCSENYRLILNTYIWIYKALVLTIHHISIAAGALLTATWRRAQTIRPSGRRTSLGKGGKRIMMIRTRTGTQRTLQVWNCIQGVQLFFFRSRFFLEKTIKICKHKNKTFFSSFAFLLLKTIKTKNNIKELYLCFYTSFFVCLFCLGREEFFLSKKNMDPTHSDVQCTQMNIGYCSVFTVEVRKFGHILPTLSFKTNN